jgi:hypothetical protein
MLNLRSTPTPERLASKRVRISRIGGWPKRRLYSRLNWAGTLISDFKGRSCGVPTIEHPCPCSLQPKLLLILKRTHGGQRLEMVVQSGDAHGRDLCEIFHPWRRRVVRLDPRDRLRRPLALISQRWQSLEGEARYKAGFISHATPHRDPSIAIVDRYGRIRHHSFSRVRDDARNSTGEHLPDGVAKQQTHHCKDRRNDSPARRPSLRYTERNWERLP